jgi:gamma-glutamylcyclotransferase (GGCT)/AIG2-like uncharacterized protein YtfP
VNTHDIFVYGTLMRGHGNNRLLERSTFLGDATTTGWFRMWQGGFPMIKAASFNAADRFVGRIIGEVWRVNDNALAALDRLESNGTMYRRTLIPVRIDGAPAAQFAQAYLWQYGTSGLYAVPASQPDRLLQWVYGE